MFSTIKNIKIQYGIGGTRMQCLKAGGRGIQYHVVCNPRNFAMIAKISLGLQKFRNHSENFAILAKLEIFAT